jgi:hypothetical protein
MPELRAAQQPEQLSQVVLWRKSGRAICRIVGRWAPVVASSQLGDRGRSPPRGRRGYRNRGKGIARPEQPREPKQSWRAQTGHAWMWAIAAGHRVRWIANPEQARSRPCVGTDRTDDRRNPDHRTVASPGGAVISSSPVHPLLRLVRTGSEVCVEARARNRWQSISVGPSEPVKPDETLRGRF